MLTLNVKVDDAGLEVLTTFSKVRVLLLEENEHEEGDRLEVTAVQVGSEERTIDILLLSESFGFQYGKTIAI